MLLFFIWVIAKIPYSSFEFMFQLFKTVLSIMIASFDFLEYGSYLNFFIFFVILAGLVSCFIDDVRHSMSVNVWNITFLLTDAHVFVDTKILDYIKGSKSLKISNFSIFLKNDLLLTRERSFYLVLYCQNEAMYFKPKLHTLMLFAQLLFIFGVCQNFMNNQTPQR